MNVDKDGLPSNCITFPARGFCDGKTITISCEDPVSRWNCLQAMAAAFGGMQHSPLELAARQCLPENGQRYQAMQNLFGEAIEDRLRRNPHDHIAPQLQHYQQKQQMEQKRCDEKFDEHIHQITLFPKEGLDFTKLRDHFFHARTLRPQSFIPYRVFLLPLSGLFGREDFSSFVESFLEEAFTQFPLETYTCLFALLEYRLGAEDRMGKGRAIHLMYSFLYNHVPNDLLLCKLVDHAREHYSWELDSKEETTEKKALYCRHFAAGLDLWFKNQTEEAKTEWLQAKHCFFSNEEIYLLLALCYAKNNDGVKAIELLVKALRARRMKGPNGRAAYLLRGDEHTIHPACSLLQGYLDFERHESDISKYLEKMLQDFGAFFGTEDLLELLVLRFILQELTSDKRLSFYNQKQMQQCTGLVFSLIKSLHYRLQELAPSFCDEFIHVDEENSYRMTIPLSSPKNEPVWRLDQDTLELDQESSLSLLKELFLEGVNWIGRINLYVLPDTVKEISAIYEKESIWEVNLPNFDVIFTVLTQFKNNRAWEECFHVMNGVLRNSATKENAPGLASFLHAFVIDQFHEATSPDLLKRAADLFEELEPLMPKEDVRFRDYKNYLFQLNGEIDLEANLDSWVGVLTAILRGESPEVDLFVMWTQCTSYEEMPFVLSVCLLLLEPENAREWVTGHSDQLKNFSSASQYKMPDKSLLEVMIKLGRDLQARNFLPSAYLFPNPKSSYREVGMAAAALFGPRARQAPDVHCQMLEERDYKDLFNPNREVDLSLNQSPPGEGALWFFNPGVSLGEAHKFFTDLCHHEMSILRGRKEHQKNIDDEKPNYLNSERFIDWVKHDKGVQEAILKGKILPEQSQFEKNVMAHLQVDISHKRAHHQKIEEIKKKGEVFVKNYANHPFKWHFLAASLIQTVHEKVKGDDYDLYVPCREDAYFILQLIEEYSRKNLRLHLLQKQHKGVDALIERELLLELLKKEEEKLVHAFHGPETHYFGHGPRYPHFNAGVFHNGSLVNTHIFFGKFA